MIQDRVRPGVDDVLDDQDVLAGDVGVEVLEDPHHAGGLGARAVGRDRHPVHRRRCRAARAQVGHDHDRALEDADEQQVLARVVRVDLGGQLVQPGVDLLLGERTFSRSAAHVGGVHGISCSVGMGLVRLRRPIQPERGAMRHLPTARAARRPPGQVAPGPARASAVDQRVERVDVPADSAPAGAPAATAAPPPDPRADGARAAPRARRRRSRPARRALRRALGGAARRARRRRRAAGRPCGPGRRRRPGPRSRSSVGEQRARTRTRRVGGVVVVRVLPRVEARRARRPRAVVARGEVEQRARGARRGGAASRPGTGRRSRGRGRAAPARPGRRGCARAARAAAPRPAAAASQGVVAGRRGRRPRARPPAARTVTGSDLDRGEAEVAQQAGRRGRRRRPEPACRPWSTTTRARPAARPAAPRTPSRRPGPGSPRRRCTPRGPARPAGSVAQLRARTATRVPRPPRAVRSGHAVDAPDPGRRARDLLRQRQGVAARSRPR